jgi:hypothetical protein
MQNSSNPANFINYYLKKLYDIAKQLNDKTAMSRNLETLGAFTDVHILFRTVDKIYDKYYNEEGLTEEDKENFIERLIRVRDEDLDNAKDYLKTLTFASNRIQLLNEFTKVINDCINNVPPPSQGGSARRRRKASRRYKKTGGKKRGSRRTRRYR